MKTTNNEITHKSISQDPDLITSWKFSDVSDTTSGESVVVAATTLPTVPTKRGQHNTKQTPAKKMV